MSDVFPILCVLFAIYLLYFGLTYDGRTYLAKPNVGDYAYFYDGMNFYRWSSTGYTIDMETGFKVSDMRIGTDIRISKHFQLLSSGRSHKNFISVSIPEPLHLDDAIEFLKGMESESNETR